jgi:hypothetical protein
MGEADQFIKRMFREETERATHEVVHFENAPEIATPSLTPDGLRVLTVERAALVSLPHPWCLLALVRAEHRRMACWVRTASVRATTRCSGSPRTSSRCTPRSCPFSGLGADVRWWPSCDGWRACAVFSL